MSSGEAEYYGLVKAASQAIGITSMINDLGINMQVVVHTDATVAKRIALRRGAGKIRHIEVNQLWLQDEAAGGEVTIQKVGTEENPADLLTKHLNREVMEKTSGVSLI